MTRALILAKYRRGGSCGTYEKKGMSDGKTVQRWQSKPFCENCGKTADKGFFILHCCQPVTVGWSFTTVVLLQELSEWQRVPATQQQPSDTPMLTVWAHKHSIMAKPAPECTMVRDSKNDTIMKAHLFMLCAFVKCHGCKGICFSRYIVCAAKKRKAAKIGCKPEKCYSPIARKVCTIFRRLDVWYASFAPKELSA